MRKVVMLMLVTLFVAGLAFINVDAGKPEKPGGPDSKIVTLTGAWAGSGPYDNITLNISSCCGSAAGEHTGVLGVFTAGGGKVKTKILHFEYDNVLLGVLSYNSGGTRKNLIIPAGAEWKYNVDGVGVESGILDEGITITE